MHGTARNPVNPQYPPGGSSSGSAAAVASGILSSATVLSCSKMCPLKFLQFLGGFIIINFE